MQFTAKGGDSVKKSSFEKVICMQFDFLMKLVIQRTKISYYRESYRRSRHEKLFCDITDFALEKTRYYDNYPSEFIMFSVFDYDIYVSNKKLGKALKELSERQRNIVLLFYYLDMSDAEIAMSYAISRSSVYRNRKKALNNLKILMKG